MIKRLLFSIICLAIFLILKLPSFAAGVTANPSISDAVYADLATRGYLDNVSVSFNGGNQGDAINLNETRHWLPASTIKLFAAMYAFKLVSDHKLNLDYGVYVDGKNVVPTELVTDELPTIQEGDTITIDRLLRQMITQSDNTAFNTLLDILDRRAITDYIHSLGLSHSAIGSKLNLDTSQEQYEFDVPGYGINTTTADDYTLAFTLIWKNKIAGAKPLLEILKQQKINNMLPLLLPKDVVVAHKHGDLDPLYHDGGIIFGPRSNYVVSIFSNIGDPNLVAHLSELIYTKDYKLVGASIPKTPSQTGVSEQNPPLDPLVAEGKFPSSTVLGAKTQTLQTQPITAADLGITAQDLSLAQPSAKLPKVIIPADSEWHFLVTSWQLIKKAIAFTPNEETQVDLEKLQLQVAEAKDLLSRGKVQGANVLLKSMQQTMNSVAKSKTIKNDGQLQTTIQAISETRFQILGDALKNASGNVRNDFIKEIGQEAKSTLTLVQPNIPLSSNATNPNQRPLIGQIIDKTDASVIVKTAGGQQFTIPLTDQTLTVKNREAVQPVVTIPAITPETISPTLIPTPRVKPSLASVEIGTTVALVGSSVGNTFTPTFVLTNVPKELSAPEPVEVVKVNKRDHTLVISENGIPVQVNVGSKTIIRGADTNVSFEAINSGDIVIVYGQPLIPITPTNIKPSPTKSILTTISPVRQQPIGNLNSQNNSTLAPSSTSTQKESTQPSLTPSTLQVVQPQPKVIQSTSIQIIEKKEDVTKKINPTTSQSKPEQKQQQKSQPPAVQSNPVTVEKKK